jgi:uncharacterized GH25 family protein
MRSLPAMLKATRLVHVFVLLSCLAWPGALLLAHDLFIRPDIFFVKPGGQITAKVFSGTFSKSENAITRDRLADLSIVTPDGRTPIDHTQWTERDPQSTLQVAAGEAGTYLIGAAVHPKLLKLDGPAFNAYLKEEGLETILAARKQQNRLNEGSRERYSKFVKAIVQVGDARTGGYAAPLGYGAEILPLANPYKLKAGDTLQVQCFVDGKPVEGLAVFAGGRTPTGARFPAQRLVSDRDGIVTVKLTGAGAWYVKFVHMRERQDADANYESRWSTLTFGLK